MASRTSEVDKDTEGFLVELETEETERERSAKSICEKLEESKIVETKNVIKVLKKPSLQRAKIVRSGSELEVRKFDNVRFLNMCQKPHP